MRRKLHRFCELQWRQGRFCLLNNMKRTDNLSAANVSVEEINRMSHACMRIKKMEKELWRSLA